MTHTIKHLFHIDAPRADVYKAITTIEGLAKWWTGQTTGDSSFGGIIQFRFGPNGGPDMKVTGLHENERVSWECTASPHGWTGHTFAFHLDDNEGKTRVRFTHNGWQNDDDFYAICTFSWGRFMESLRQLCQSGSGNAFAAM